MVATVIKSSQLDFANIKESLKNYLKQKDEFADYDFEAAGLNNVLDVLAYNTHLNALNANFSINESFLNTAQLRSSVVSHAETLGYEVRSMTTSKAVVNLSVNLAGVANRPPQIQLPSGFSFTSNIDGISYTFQTQESYFARDDGSGNYEFKTAKGSLSIPIYEGIEKTKTFISGENTERQIFVIPDGTIDTSTAKVLVYDTATSTGFNTYIPLKQAITVDANSRVYSIRETPNGNYELNFGDGVSFGKKPDPGNKIVVTYLSTKGEVADNGTLFTPNSDLTIASLNNSFQVLTNTVTESTGGSDRQTIESVRQLAPIAYAQQARLVTSLDYKGMILSNFTDVTDCNVWSGDENVPRDYGAVYVSLNFANGVSDVIKDQVKANIITNFTDNLAVVSMTTKYTDPVDLFLELVLSFNFDPALTGFSLAATESAVYNFMVEYFQSNLNKFDKTFRRSNMLTEVDAIDPAILSSKCDVKAQLRIFPTIGTNRNFELQYPMQLKGPDDFTYTVISSVFEYDGSIALIRNKLNSQRLQIQNIDGDVLLDNVGEFIPTKGQVNIVGFAPQAFIGGSEFIKISAIPLNESVIKPLRNYVVKLDPSLSYATASLDRQDTKLTVG